MNDNNLTINKGEFMSVSASSTATVTTDRTGPTIDPDVRERLVQAMYDRIAQAVQARQTIDQGSIETSVSLSPDGARLEGLPNGLPDSPEFREEVLDSTYYEAYERAAREGLIASPISSPLPMAVRLQSPQPRFPMGPVTGTGAAPQPRQIEIVYGSGSGDHTTGFVGNPPSGAAVPFNYVRIPNGYTYAGLPVFIPTSVAPSVVEAGSFNVRPAFSQNSRRMEAASNHLNAAIRREIAQVLGLTGTISGPMPRIEYEIRDGRFTNVRVTQMPATVGGRPVSADAAQRIVRGLEGQAVPPQAFGLEGRRTY